MYNIDGLLVALVSKCDDDCWVGRAFPAPIQARWFEIRSLDPVRQEIYSDR